MPKCWQIDLNFASKLTILRSAIEKFSGERALQTPKLLGRLPIPRAIMHFAHQFKGLQVKIPGRVMQRCMESVISSEWEGLWTWNLVRTHTNTHHGARGPVSPVSHMTSKVANARVADVKPFNRCHCGRGHTAGPQHSWYCVVYTACSLRVSYPTCN